ncbi:MAG: MBL fold metallo-hydrolase [Rhodothermales bacterium]|nr:MBL fold metallo-hydrolase [Rhodothermales bacterium]
MFFRQIFDDRLAQYAYLIGCQQTKEAILIDPERDIDRYIRIAESENLVITAAADTHIHADYLSGLRQFAERGVHVYASDEGGDDWKYEWLKGSDYAHTLVRDGDTFRIGNIEFRVVHTPGHTPEHIVFTVTDHGGGADEPMGIVTGDFVFVGDLGRPDLLESAAGEAGAMEPSARDLYGSVQRFLEFEDYLQVWPAHGAGSACGKALGAVPESTVGYERRFNASIEAAGRGEDAFVDAILDGQPEPPMYFARMKRDNRLGPAVYDRLPEPSRLDADGLGALAGSDTVALIDTRLDRARFMAGHIPGSLYAPFNKSFATVVGSYVEETTPVYLIVEDEHRDEAIRCLVRIGLDHVVSTATPADVQAYADAGGELASIPRIDMGDVPDHTGENTVVLDVRNRSEFDAGHVPGAMNIAHTRLWLRRGEVPAGGTKLVHCQAGGRSAVAAALLARLGHDVIFVDGQFESYSTNHPVDREAAVTA